MKKENITHILLGLLILLLTWQNFFPNKEKEVEIKTITVPEIKGTTGERIIERVITQPVYIPQTKQNFEVDSEWKSKYEKALDSLEKTKLYLEAIKINNYEELLVDNDTISIKGFATTRGSLLNYNVDYKIKTFDIKYEPEVVYKNPRLSMGLFLESGIPTQQEVDFLSKGSVLFENKKGNGLSLGYDTEKRVWIGLHKTFKILK